MKKHLQFNDITALSLGWRAARRKAEKERRAEREKEQSSSSLLCIFIKENITSSPLVLPFSSPLLAFLSHSFTFPPLFCLSVLCSLSPFFLISPLTHFPLLSIVSPYSSIWAIQFCLMRRCLSHNVSFFCVVLSLLWLTVNRIVGGIRTFHFKALQICSLAFLPAPSSVILVILLHIHRSL